MPMISRSTEHGVLSFLEPLSVVLGTKSDELKVSMEITRFNGPTSCLTFFGRQELLRIIGERPYPRDYFKAFRAERYRGELHFLTKQISIAGKDRKEVKRDIMRAFFAQIAIEAVFLFSATEPYAKSWLEKKLADQRSPHDFQQTWSAYRAVPLPIFADQGSDDLAIFDVIYSCNRLQHKVPYYLKWLSFRGISQNGSGTFYDMMGYMVRQGKPGLEATLLPISIHNPEIA